MNSEYYAVIFTSTTSDDLNGYQEWSDKMIELAKSTPGFISVESARNAIGITVSYWNDLESISNFKKLADHRYSQQRGREQWYRNYRIRICRVERDYSFP
jgi:heme-degrading monooxygenase HmoA